jgi:hypothetical protein
MAKNTINPQMILDSFKEFVLVHMANETNPDKLEVFHLFIDEINRQDDLLVAEIEAKRIKDEKSFDEHHNNFEVLKERGHIAYTTDYHFYLSEYSKGVVDSDYVFENLTSDDKSKILSSLFNNDFNEQMTALRYKYCYITAKHGHDGVDVDNNVYEAKSTNVTKYSKVAPKIGFAGPSKNVLRKLTEGRPLFILNVMESHKLICELLVECTDELLAKFQQQLESGRNQVEINYKDYAPHIKEIAFIRDGFEEYEPKLNKKLFELLVIKSEQKKATD